MVTASTTSRCLASALTLLLLTCSPELGAQELEARDLFARATRILSAGRRHEALALFVRSLELARRSSTILNVAQCYRLLDFPLDAVTYYQQYLEGNGRSSRIRYRDEVRRHLDALQVLHGLLVKAREHQRDGDHVAAIAALARARQLTRWPGLALSLARSHLALRREGVALVYARSALAGYDSHLERWREAGFGPPRHVQTEADEARRLVQRLEPRKAAIRPAPSSADRAKPRSRVWLTTAIVAGSLAVAAEIMALIFYQKANELQSDDPAFDRYKSVVIAGHVCAGLFAVVSGTSVVLHLKLAHRDPSPGGGRGALVTATVRF